MARIRTIKPSFWGNSKVARCSNNARLLFIGMLNLADDEGRLLGSTRRIAGELFPHDDALAVAEVDLWMGELRTVGLVAHYEVEGISYVAFPGWNEHQRISHPTPSTLPPPTSHSEVIPELLCPEGEQGRGRGTGKRNGSGRTSVPDPFTVSTEMWEWAQAKVPTVDARRETEKFLDYYRAKGTKHIDWVASWRNWMRNSVKFNR